MIAERRLRGGMIAEKPLRGGMIAEKPLRGGMIAEKPLRGLGKRGPMTIGVGAIIVSPGSSWVRCDCAVIVRVGPTNRGLQIISLFSLIRIRNSW
jgi:hypothetical protein